MGTSTDQEREGAGSQHLQTQANRSQPKPTQANSSQPAPRQSHPDTDLCAGGLVESPPRGPEGLRGLIPNSTVHGREPATSTGRPAKPHECTWGVRAIRGAVGEHDAHEHARTEARGRIAHLCLGEDGKFLTRCRLARNSPAHKMRAPLSVLRCVGAICESQGDAGWHRAGGAPSFLTTGPSRCSQQNDAL